MKSTSKLFAAGLLAALAGNSYASGTGHGPSFEERERMQMSRDSALSSASPSSYHPPEGFQVVYVGQLERAERQQALNAATPDGVRTAQEDVTGDPSTAEEMKAHNVQLQNVIGVRTTFTGGKVYYVR